MRIIMRMRIGFRTRRRINIVLNIVISIQEEETYKYYKY